MANRSVADFVFFLNQQIDLQKQIEVHLCNLDALLAVSLLTTNFYDLPKNNLHHYFSVVSDLIDELIKINQINLGQLMTQEQ